MVCSGGNDDNNFSIGTTTGIIRVNMPLDRESRDEYWLTVEASQVTELPNPEFATQIVIVRVADVNDNPPQFSKQIYITGQFS